MHQKPTLLCWGMARIFQIEIVLLPGQHGLQAKSCRGPFFATRLDAGNSTRVQIIEPYISLFWIGRAILLGKLPPSPVDRDNDALLVKHGDMRRQ